MKRRYMSIVKIIISITIIPSLQVLKLISQATLVKLVLIKPNLATPFLARVCPSSAPLPWPDSRGL